MQMGLEFPDLNGLNHRLSKEKKSCRERLGDRLLQETWASSSYSRTVQHG